MRLRELKKEIIKLSKENKDKIFCIYTDILQKYNETVFFTADGTYYFKPFNNKFTLEDGGIEQKYIKQCIDGILDSMKEMSSNFDILIDIYGDYTYQSKEEQSYKFNIQIGKQK